MMQRALILAMALLCLAAKSQAIETKTLETIGVEQRYAARSSIVSSHTVSGFGLSWSVYAVGGAADLIVKHSTVVAGGYAASTSSTIYVLSGQNVSDKFYGLVKNPILLISRIDAATTVYVDIGYLSPRAPGNF